MSTAAAKFVFSIAFVLGLMLSATRLPAQDVTSTLSGIITDSAGKAVPNAKVSIKNAATGESHGSQTDSEGHYTFSNLAAGDYEVSVSGKGVGAGSAKTTLAAGSQQTVNLTLSTTSTSAPPAENLPNAPSASEKQPSLEDLGFSKTETQADAREQALLDKRTHMLKIHQRMGLI